MLGISGDGAEAHARFKAKYGLPMRLLVDEGHAIAESYGVWVEKNTFGVKRMGIARTTFIVDPDGKVAHTFSKVDPSGHGQAIAETLERLSSG